MKAPRGEVADSCSFPGSIGPGKAALCVALLSVFSGYSEAARINYQVELATLRSDNINLSDEDPVSEDVFIPRVRFDISQEGSNVSINARGGAEYRDYLDNSFPDEWRGDFAGQLNWSMLPERASFVVEDYLRYQPISLDRGPSPGNLQRVNVFIAGPTLHARFSDATRFQLDMRVANSYAETTEDFNGNRYTGAARLQREISGSQQASLNLVATRAEFDDAAQAADYSRQDGFIGYRLDRSKLKVEVDAGGSRLRPRDGHQSETSSLVRGGVGWQATARSRVGVNARYQLADAVQDMVIRTDDLNDPIIPELSTSSVLVSPDVYRERWLDVDYRYRGDRLNLRVREYYRRARYVDDPTNNREDRGIFGEARYRLSPTLTASFVASARNREFQNSQREDDDRFYSVGCDYQSNRHLSWRASVYRNTRDSTETSRRYKENAFQLAVIWRR